MRKRFLLITGDGKNGSVLGAARVLWLFHFNSHTDGGGTKFFFLKYIICTAAQAEVDRELSCAGPMGNTTDEENHSAFTWEERNSRTELNVGVWFGEELFIAIRGAVHAMQGSCAIPPQRRSFRGRMIDSTLIDNTEMVC